MILVDTSVWIEVLRRREALAAFQEQIGEEPVVLSRFSQRELLFGDGGSAHSLVGRTSGPAGQARPLPPRTR